MVLDATARYDAPLTAERLFGWHAALFPTGYNGLTRIRVGDWRNDVAGPMEVVSGPLHRQRVHYEAPPATRLRTEMKEFLAWANAETPEPPLVKAGLAHLWFVTVHPFDDGNGRIARAVGDLFLARADASGQRFYSLSAQIQRDRRAYYEVLERTQKGPLDVTPWLLWFLRTLNRAVDSASQTEWLIGGEALQALLRQLAAQLRITRISPYQTRGGVTREGSFFGRAQLLARVPDAPEGSKGI
eukprot:gene8369-10649_t